MIVMNDLARHHAPLRDQIEAAIARVLQREHYILGNEVAAFEQAFAAWCDARECIAVANGTDALELALRAAEIGAGDEVATVANAGMYATTAIRAVGAIPVYIDIDQHLLMDPAALALCRNPRLRAVIVTHLYGRFADMNALARIAQARGLALIEDCAQAHGAAHAGRKAGTFGRIGCFSFYPTKNLGALGDAGALVTDDPSLATRLRALRTYGWSAKYHSDFPGGINSRMDELQAAVLSVKLPHVQTWNRRRREIARLYASAITHPAIMLPQLPAASDGESYVAHLYVVHTTERDALRAHLAACDIATDVHYPVPDHRQKSARENDHATGLERTEEACATVLSLPCYPELADAEVEAVASACNRWRLSP